MDDSFFHERDAFILLSDGVLHVVVQLNLNLVLKLASLGQELLAINVLNESVIILRDKFHLTNVGPRVMAIAHGALGPDTDVLSSS